MREMWKPTCEALAACGFGGYLHGGINDQRRCPIPVLLPPPHHALLPLPRLSSLHSPSPYSSADADLDPAAQQIIS